MYSCRAARDVDVAASGLCSTVGRACSKRLGAAATHRSRRRLPASASPPKPTTTRIKGRDARDLGGTNTQVPEVFLGVWADLVVALNRLECFVAGFEGSKQFGDADEVERLSGCRGALREAASCRVALAV